MRTIRARLTVGLRWRLAVWIAGVMLVSAIIDAAVRPRPRAGDGQQPPGGIRIGTPERGEVANVQASENDSGRKLVVARIGYSTPRIPVMAPPVQ
ncbi:MAG TPA: hypothetical protein VFI54_24395 [Solirubrobacteraceae bacterium]|nr:hypothetical protein [Solirubrobacteraceae bacterium]